MRIRALAVIALVYLGLVSVGDGSVTGLGLLSPLLPIAALTGHAGLFSSGLTGAALLKLKAAAALGGLLLFKKGGVNVDFGWTNDQHGWGQVVQNHGWGQNNYGWHRRRRRATEADGRGDTADLTPDNPYDPTLDEVLQYDQLGCGMRLVCELSSTAHEKLMEDEKLILELFGRDETAPDPAKASRGKLSYSYAALLGANAKSSEACGRVYASCPYSAEQTMQSLREANI